ncbi:MAG: PilT/PilU family type 4a pilus ATPase [Pseudomonadales bacterium]|nr:PilT/PilU family type 4a pilus ATPase [Pseudomonadales bacterium]
MKFEELLKMMVEKEASDLFISAGVPPTMKLLGKTIPITKQILTPEQAHKTVLSVMTEAQRKEFLTTHECNFAISAAGIGRFRVSAFFQRNFSGMVLRRIQTDIPKLDDIGLPDTIKELSMIKRGLVFIVGATGSGKSTSLAAMIGHRNQNSNGHIISIEDPIEFIHQHQNCIITQREVGIDTESFEVGLKNTLRQAPDVIMIGEIRTREAMGHAIAFAETGHLCLATLHANNANQAIDRIINFFPSESHNQILMDLSLNLKAIVAQQLIPTVDGKNRQPVIEILLNSPLMADQIRTGEFHEIKALMTKSRESGMQTFDQALFDLYKANQISYQDALAYADSANDLRLMIKMDKNLDVDMLSHGGKNLKLESYDAGSSI